MARMTLLFFILPPFLWAQRDIDPGVPMVPSLIVIESAAGLRVMENAEAVRGELGVILRQSRAVKARVIGYLEEFAEEMEDGEYYFLTAYAGRIDGYEKGLSGLLDGEDMELNGRFFSFGRAAGRSGGGVSEGVGMFGFYGRDGLYEYVTKGKEPVFRRIREAVYGQMVADNLLLKALAVKIAEIRAWAGSAAVLFEEDLEELGRVLETGQGAYAALGGCYGLHADMFRRLRAAAALASEFFTILEIYRTGV